MSERRNIPPHRDCKREFQRSREFGRPQIHSAVVRTRQQSPAWPPTVPAPAATSGTTSTKPKEP